MKVSVYYCEFGEVCGCILFQKHIDRLTYGFDIYYDDDFTLIDEETLSFRFAVYSFNMFRVSVFFGRYVKKRMFFREIDLRRI